MGCTQSKIENEETVTRCKDRKQYMKDAVSARNAFAAAHSSYAISLKNTGAALSDYAHGEVQFSSSASSAAAAASSSLTGGPQPPYDSVLPPPPPLPEYTSSPLQRATSMPEISMAKPDMKYTDPILEEDEDEIEAESAHGLRHHRSSKSSGGGGGSRTGIPRQKVEEEPLPPPPSPPRTPPKSDHPPPPPLSTGMASWDFFFPSMENVPGPTLAGVDEDQAEREEIERKMREESSKRSEVDGGVGRKSGKIGADVVLERAGELPPQPQPQPKPQLQPQPQPPPPAAPKVVKRVKQVAGESLLQIFSKLDDCFLKASESAREVSKMLEANRLHYHSNFADNRGHIDHSARVMRVITWNRSFRGLPNADDGKDDFDSEENETHATVLDKMLAWEKKLYDEVKAGEQMKLEYQRKVASLNKLKKHSSSTESLERTKAAVSHLHTRYIVDMQSMDSTVSEINRLRDAQLYPKLIVLVDGMATMWEKMEEQHKNQSDIVEALRSLDISNSAKETTEHHHERTVQLSSVVQEWRSQFEKLIFNQKSYVKSLNNWLKLNLIPIDNNLKEKVSSPQRPQNPPIQTLLHAWHDHLEKLPEEPARRAISNFEALISTIIHYQADEMKLRDKCEETRKEVLKRGRQFEDWHHKYMQKRTPVDEMDPERAGDKDLVMERQAAVEVLKQRLEEEEDAYRRQCVQVREKSVASLKTCLPELFRVLAVFAQNCSETYGRLRYISEPQHVSNE